MTLYNNYKSNTTIDLSDNGDGAKSTHICKAWIDSFGDVHLDIQMDCTRKDGLKIQFIIPNLCIPMDGTIHLKTLCEPKYNVPISLRVWYEPKRDIQLFEGWSNSINASPSAQYYVTLQCIDPPVKEMTLEEIERKLGYKVKVVSTEKK